VGLLISTGHLDQTCLAGKVAIVTGGGRSIGLAASRALLWMGARVVVAEIDEEAAAAAVAGLAGEWGADRIRAVPTDVADEADVARLLETVRSTFGAVDVVLNNATAAPTGDAVWETEITDWDRSYAVNLRGPALLARACLPEMVERKSGVFVCVSSAGGPYQAAYESLKAAQVALASSLEGELSGTGVVAFTIGPGLVPTETAVAAVQRLLPRLGLSGAEFLRLTRPTLISVEAAGAGFAAAIAMANRYAGQEISSTQALVDAGITLPETPVSFPLLVGEPKLPTPAGLSSVAVPAELAARCRRVRITLSEQVEGWRQRSFFERQWMLRDFKQRAGMPVERWVELLEGFERALDAGQVDPLFEHREQLAKLAGFYAHLGDLAHSYVKDPLEREAQLQTVADWEQEVRDLIAEVGA
jgi:NAD(P)-dependent dehydrogenase (short-subunit alcohol dehydrogenase family)